MKFKLGEVVVIKRLEEYMEDAAELLNVRGVVVTEPFRVDKNSTVGIDLGIAWENTNLGENKKTHSLKGMLRKNTGIYIQVSSLEKVEKPSSDFEVGDIVEISGFTEEVDEMRGLVKSINENEDGDDILDASIELFNPSKRLREGELHDCFGDVPSGKGYFVPLRYLKKVG